AWRAEGREAPGCGTSRNPGPHGPRLAALLLVEQRQAGGEAVDEVLPADGAELAHGEEAGQRQRAEQRLHGAGVVVGLVEQPGPAAVAAEEECPRGAGRALASGVLQEQAEVLVGRAGVADVELHRLADADAVAEDQGAALTVQAEDVADQEVAAAERVLVLVDDQADVRALPDELLVARAQLLPELLELDRRGLATQLQDGVLVGAGDDQRLADGPAALRDDAP